MIGRILIVEPDPKTAQELLVLFQSADERFEGGRYEIEMATCVSQAVELAQTISFDCIIMDVELPEMKGYEATGLVRTTNKLPPIILTADNNTPETEAKVREQDVFYYHVRAFGPDELKLAVRSIFEKLPARERVRKTGAAIAKPVALKQLRLSRAN